MDTGLSWVDTVLDSSEGARTRLKRVVIDGIKKFNAKWRKNSDMVGTDKNALEFAKMLESGEVQFIGFVPNVQYIKEKGNKEELEAIWKHNLGTPGLLFAMKNLPALIIAGPEIRFNKSVISQIDANRNLPVAYESVEGITG